MSVDDTLFGHLVDACLPSGGLCVILSEVYFDESGTHDGSPVMTLAGYVFNSGQARLFSRDWGKALAKLNLPCAHMTDCANGKADYAGMSLEQRILSEKLLIENIKRRTSVGFSISVCPDEYETIMGDYSQVMSAYTLLLMVSVLRVSEWALARDYQGKIAYFFEAGHRHSSEADYYMNGLHRQGREILAHNYYAAHAFVDKKLAKPLQAADMLAWLHRNSVMKRMGGADKPRADFIALVRPQDMGSEVTAKNIRQLRGFMEEGVGIFDRLPDKLAKVLGRRPK